MKTKLIILLLIPFVTHAQTATVLWSAGDNFNAIKSALNSSATYIMLQPGKVYDISARADVPSGKTLDAQGSTLHLMSTFPSDTRPAVSTPITQTKNVGSLSISVTAGSNTFNYSGAGTLVNGQILILYGGTYATYNGADYRNGWHGGVIVSHTSTTVTMQYAAKVSFTATSLKCWRPATDVTIKNFRVDCRSTTGRFGGIGAEYAVRAKILNCISEGVPGTSGPKRGIRMIGCVDSKISNSLAYNGVMGGSSDAPGIELDGMNDTIQYCRVLGFATGLSDAGRDYIASVHYLDNEIAHGGSWTGIDAHANAEAEIKRNKLWMFNPGNYKLHSIHVRRGNSDVEDNIVYYPDGGVSLLGIYHFEQGYFNCIDKNNTFYYATVAPTAVYVNPSISSPMASDWVNVNNQVTHMATIPAAPPAELMFPTGTTPVVDTGVVVVPLPPPADTSDCYFIHFAAKR